MYVLWILIIPQALSTDEFIIKYMNIEYLRDSNLITACICKCMPYLQDLLKCLWGWGWSLFAQHTNNTAYMNNSQQMTAGATTGKGCSHVIKYVSLICGLVNAQWRLYDVQSLGLMCCIYILCSYKVRQSIKIRPMAKLFMRHTQ